MQPPEDGEQVGEGTAPVAAVRGGALGVYEPGLHKGDVAVEVAPAGICLSVLRGSALGALLPMLPAAPGGGGSLRRGDAGVMPGAGKDPGSCVALTVPVSITGRLR